MPHAHASSSADIFFSPLGFFSVSIVFLFYVFLVIFLKAGVRIRSWDWNGIYELK